MLNPRGSREPKNIYKQNREQNINKQQKVVKRFQQASKDLENWDFGYKNQYYIQMKANYQ